MTTIREVARRLNISITTVSRALDGYSDVAEETRRLVKQTAEQMGYAPNRAARQLRRRRADTIGYILPASALQFSDPFFSEFIAGLGDEATVQDFDLLVSTAAPGSQAEVSAYERWVQGRKVDGMVLNRMRRQDWRAGYLARAGLPFVSLERAEAPGSHACVEVNGRAGFELLMGHLAGKGHRRIAYIGGPRELVIQVDRFEGYRKGLTAAGLPFEAALVAEGDTLRSGGYLAAQRLLDLPHPPTAITCINDLTAIGVLHAAGERGIKVGSELAVAGFDGIAECEHTTPPLTTLSQSLYAIARSLVSMLSATIRDQPLAEPRVRLQPELIVRASTGG